MPAPANEDAVIRHKEGYLDMYQTKCRPWSVTQQKKLRTAALEEAKEVLLLVAQRELNDANRSLKNAKGDANPILERKEQLELEIKKLRNMPLQNLKVPKDLKLDWMKIEAQSSDGHRTAAECEAQWETLLNPNISQKPFSEKDEISIRTEVLKCGKSAPDWEKIATMLSEPRSAFQVFQRYQCFIAPVLAPPKWTKANNDKLMSLIQTMRVGEYIPWAQIHQQIPGFSRYELQAKWKRLNPFRIKGAFRMEEDYAFLKGMHKYGLDYDQILNSIPNRDKNQLKDHFRRYFMSNFFNNWTKEMDDALMVLAAEENGRLNETFWKRLSTIEEFAKSQKDAPMLRLRYLRLQLWHAVKGDTEEQMCPIFPLSSTRDEDEIKQILWHCNNADASETRQLISDMNAGNHMEKAKVNLDRKRKRLHMEHDHHQLKKNVHLHTTRPVRINNIHLHHLTTSSQVAISFYYPIFPTLFILGSM